MFSRRGGSKGDSAKDRFANRLQKVASETAPEPQDRSPFRTRGDRRTSGVERVRLRIPGTIVQANGDRHPVVVGNLSETGAELRSMRALGMLSNFELLVPSHGVRRSARVAWRGDGVFGVEFVD